MTQYTPQCGDWLKLVESLALKRQDEDGGQVAQGDYFRFLGPSAAEGFCECYAPRLQSRFWIKLDYLHPIKDSEIITTLESTVPDSFKQPSQKIRSSQKFNDGLASVIGEIS